MKVGLVGTGYAAKLRAETLHAELRTELVAMSGNTPDRLRELSQTYGAIACSSWQDLVHRPDLDLVIISTMNQNHSAIAQAALEAGKHVVVEYPLALTVAEAAHLIALAQQQQRLLHVEHIELLGGVHQALKASLPLIGPVFSARYITVKPERPAPQRWSYHLEQFGFPLMGALSRLHRLTDLFGQVETVTCQAQFWSTDSSTGTHLQHSSRLPKAYFSTCLCTAHLRFKTGLIAEVTYGKGEALWATERKFEVQGEKGALIFEGDQGTLLQACGSQPIPVAGRRGLFAKDTAMVVDYLTLNTPLYVSPEASLYTMKVAEAAQRSLVTGQTVAIADE